MRAALSWIRYRKTHLLAALFVCLLAVFLFVKSAHAEGSLETSINAILTFLIEVVQWFIEMLGALVLFLTSLLVNAAKYNDFTNAYPVVTGWVLVRDVVNMFFIVVLLLMAFSTIIGYSEFHYEKHLPKLLLMAVLINFSKTLVGVLIDFSQVLMLTFVSGFQAAAGGNFINALKLTKVTQLNQKLTEANAQNNVGTQTIPNLLIASVLGLAMLLIAAGVLLVLCIYIIVRVIGLWVLLIFSPIAFFALALPAKLQSSLSVFTNEWWKNLSTLLTGGPIVAFFLWLSLATVQGKPETFQNFYQAQSATEEQSISPAITQAAEPKELASFIVAIIMLLAGLSTAVKATDAISPKALGLAKAGGAIGVGASKFLARNTFRAGVGTAKLAGRGAAAGASSIDARLGKYGTKGVSNLAFLAADKLAGSKFGAPFASIAARAGKSFGSISATRSEAYGKDVKARYAGLSGAKLLTAYKAQLGSANPEQRQVLQKEILKLEMSRPGKALTKRNLEQEWLKQHPDDPGGAKAYADARSRQVNADNLSVAKKMAEEKDDIEWLEKLEEEQGKDPSANNDFAGIAGGIGKKDYKQALRDLKPDALTDSATALAVAKSFGFINERGGIVADYQNTEQWKDLAKSPMRKNLMERQMGYLASPAGQQAAGIQLAAMKSDATDEQKKAALAARYNINAHGQFMTVGSAVGGEGAVYGQAAPRLASLTEATRNVSGATRQNLEDRLAAAGMDVPQQNALGSRFTAPLTDIQAQQLVDNVGLITGTIPANDVDAAVGKIQSMQTAQIPAEVAAGFDASSGKYRSPANLAAHQRAYQQAFNKIASNIERGNADASSNDIEFLSNTPPDLLASENEMSNMVVEQFIKNLETLSLAVRNKQLAKDPAGKAQVAKLERVLGTLYKKASDASTRLKTAGGTFTDYDNKLDNLHEEFKASENSPVRTLARSGAKKVT